MVFAAFAWLDEGAEPTTPERIEISEEIRERLATQFKQTWRRAPTHDELAALVDNYVEEEVLVREAVLLGLDRDDTVIRQRLALKMKFLLEAGGGTLDPSDEELANFLSENEERYKTPARLSFEQLLLVRSAVTHETILSALNRGENPETYGVPTLLPFDVSDATARAVDSVFGAGFFAQLEAISEDQWAGPVESGYGTHLVRITGYTPARRPSLDDVRESVTRDWISLRTEEIARQRLDALLSRYDVVHRVSGETE